MAATANTPVITAAGYPSEGGSTTTTSLSGPSPAVVFTLMA